MNEFKFELHTHTVHSDGKFTPEELIRTAKARGYYGIAVTDHNTSTGCAEAIEWGKKLGVLVIPGIEWTTFYGHIVVIGGNSKVDWRSVTPETIIEKIKEAQSAGDLVGLAHPYRVGYPVCTGGRNRFPNEIFDHLDYYEVLSGEIGDVTNERSKKEYLDLVGKGKRLSATYGRDWHSDSDLDGALYGATYLLSQKNELSLSDALALIKDGKTKVGLREKSINLLEESL